MEIVHIYQQAYWHDDAYIVGNRTGIEQLHAALTLALDSGADTARPFARDSKGYRIEVHVVDDETAMKLALPYTDELARERDVRVLRPWQLPSHDPNPVAARLAKGSGHSIVQMMSAFIPMPEGDNAVFGERALSMITGACYALTDLRDGGYLEFAVGTLRDFLPLEKYESLAFDPRLRTQAARAATLAYLQSLPNWKSPEERQANAKKGSPEPIAQEAYQQHGFAQMYFTREFTQIHG
jgi:hypothetical protein